MEQASPAARTLWPTLTSCFRPIETYLEWLATATGGAPAPALALTALDAFLLRQLAASFPGAPTVIDLAADALNGASVAGWLAGDSTRYLSVPAYGPPGAWRQHLPAIAELLHWQLNRCEVASTLPSLPPADWAKLTAASNPLAPVLVLLPAHLVNVREVLTSLHQWQPQAIVALIGVSKTEATPAFKAALDYCAAQPAFTLTLLREISPFFFGSSLVLLHPAEHADIKVFATSLRQSYEGNFQFLAMAQALTQTSLQTAPPKPPAFQPYMPSFEPPTFADLRGETKRWLWQRVLPPWFKRALSRARQRPVD